MSEKANIRPGRANLKPERADLRVDLRLEGTEDGGRRISLYGIIGHRPLRGRCPKGKERKNLKRVWVRDWGKMA